MRLALAFIVAAVVAGATADSAWLGLHLFLAGAVVLAISGVSLMLTVTWSAAPAPPSGWVGVQRACIAVGAAGIAIAREATLPGAAFGAAGGVYLAGLVLLAGLLVRTVRRGVERRFDVTVAAYVVAIGAGVIGVGLGASMAVGWSSPAARGAHVSANLLGLVGLVVGATMPFFAATVGRSRMGRHATPRLLAVTLCWQASALVLVLAGFAAGATVLVVIGFGAYAAGVALVLASLPRPGPRQLRWAGPRLVALWAGGCWWLFAVAATAVDAAAHRPVLGERWLWVLVLAGYAQIVWGSLAYLLPMLRGGGHERLTSGFAASRSWPGFAAVNLAGIALVLDAPTPVTVTLLVVWLLDGAWRVARIGTSRAPRPDDEGSAQIGAR